MEDISNIFNIENSIAVLEPGERPVEKSDEAEAIERRIAAEGDDNVKMHLSDEN